MIELSTIRDLVAISGVLIALGYYIINIRNQRVTRQTQLLMNLYETYRSPEFIHDWDQVIWRFEFNDWEDAMRKLHPLNNPEERKVWFSVGLFFNGVGVLVKRKLINITLVDELLGDMIMMTWEKMGPIEVESRVRLNNPRAFEDFEYLYNEILRVGKGRGSLEGIQNGFKPYRDQSNKQ